MIANIAIARPPEHRHAHRELRRDRHVGARSGGTALPARSWDVRSGLSPPVVLRAAGSCGGRGSSGRAPTSVRRNERPQPAPRRSWLTTTPKHDLAEQLEAHRCVDPEQELDQAK